MTTARYRHAIIGTGRPHGSEGATGFGMAHYHIRGFQYSERADTIAIAELRDDNARLFLDKHKSEAKHYHDYRRMLAEEKPDIVSVCVWPHLHAEMTVAAAEAGVKAIHCEKPMATTWGDAKRMKAAADANGAILTFNHQRRFVPACRHMRAMLAEKTIGDLLMLEADCGDLYDWGTHWFDMMFFFNDESPAEWVIGQIDSRAEKIIFGAPVEGQGVCHWKSANGVRGLMVTGFESKIGERVAIRAIGTEGVMELMWDLDTVRVRANGDAEWRLEKREHDREAIDHACADLVRALDEPGYKPLLSADNAIQSTEVIFATYYSSKNRSRVETPLSYEGNAFHDLLESGEIGPNRRL